MSNDVDKQELERALSQAHQKIAELEGKLGARRGSAKRKVYEAALEEARIDGFDMLFGKAIKRSKVSQGAVYATHYPGGKEQVLSELCQQMHTEANAAALEILKIKDGRSAMMAWMRFHAEHVSKFGMLSAHLLAGRMPPGVKSDADPAALKRFFGHLVKRCKEQGYCRQDVSTRIIVITWAYLLHGDRVSDCLADGRSLEEICESTMDIMVRSFYVNSSCLLVRSVDPLTNVETVRYEGVIDDDYYLSFHRELFANENFVMDRGIADLRNAREVQITPDAIRKMCAWAKLIPDKFPAPAKLAVIAGEGNALEVAQNYYDLMNDGPVNVEVFKTIDEARLWLMEEEAGSPIAS